MRVKPILVLALCLVVCASALAPRASAQQLSKEDKIRLLLTMMKPDGGVTDEIFKQMTQEMSTIAPRPGATPEEQARAEAVQSKLLDLFKDKMSPEKMTPLFVPIYADTFTDSEIDGMLAFYQSPAGRALAEKMPTLLLKTMQVMQQQMQQEMQELVPEMQRIVEESLPRRGTH